MNQRPDNLQARRRRLLWRATHRGIKEMDVLLGGFAKANIDRMQPSALDELEGIIDIPDQQLLIWIMGQSPVPAAHQSATLAALISFRP
jgi:antitoxin CptB